MTFLNRFCGVSKKVSGARFPFLALVLFLNLCGTVNCVQIHPYDKNLLDQALRNTIVLPSGWDKSNTIGACDWSGITCNNQGQLTHFDVTTANFSSTIPPAFSQFPALIRLRLFRADIFGTIPPSLFTKTLISLDLSQNYLNGSIPDAIANSTGLITLMISSNALTGTIPRALEQMEIENLSMFGNQFGCPFPEFFYQKLKNASATICRFEMNNWDIADDGTICNSNLKVDMNSTKCTVFPTLTNRNLRTRSADWSFTGPTLQVEVHGSSIAVFPRYKNGTVYRKQYASYTLQAIHLYDEVQPPRGSDRQDVRIFQALPIERFSRMDSLGGGAYEFVAQFSNQRIRQASLIFETQHPTAPGGLKFSARVKGIANIFENRTATLPGNVGLVNIFQIKGNFFKDNDRLNCPIADNLLSGNNFCVGDRYRSALNFAYLPPLLRWIHNTTEFSCNIDIPLEFRDESGEIVSAAILRDGLFVNGVGNSKAVLNPWFTQNFTVWPEDQGLSVTYELLFRNVTSQLDWDPTISLLLLEPNDTPGSTVISPSVQLESQSVNLAAAIAVPIVVVAVVGAIGLIMLVPSLRHKVLPSSGANKEMKRRLQSVEQGMKPKENAFAPPRAEGPESKRWTTARPTDPSSV